MPPSQLELRHGNWSLATWPRFLLQLLPGLGDLVVDAMAWHSEPLALLQQKPLEHRKKVCSWDTTKSNKGMNKGFWFCSSVHDKTRVKKFIWLLYLHVKTVDQTWQGETLTEKEERSAGGHLKEMGKLCDQVRTHDSVGVTTLWKRFSSTVFLFDQLQLEGISEKTWSNK